MKLKSKSNDYIRTGMMIDHACLLFKIDRPLTACLYSSKQIRDMVLDCALLEAFHNHYHGFPIGENLNYG